MTHAKLLAPEGIIKTMPVSENKQDRKLIYRIMISNDRLAQPVINAEFGVSCALNK